MTIRELVRRRFRGWPLRDRPLMVASLVFVLAAMMAAAVITQIEVSLSAQRRSQASQVAASHAQGIQRRLERALTATYALAALVRQGQGEIGDFAAVATEMLPFYPGAASLQLAPDGVVRQIVPLVGNEAAIGHDLLADPARTKEAFLAKDTGRLTLAGPFELMQGGLGAVGRLPVFLDADSGQSRFWGFTNVLLRFPEVLDPSRLVQLTAQGYDYLLWRRHPDTGERQIIAAAGSAPLVDPVDQSLEVPNGHWTLSLSPRAGWHDRAGLGLRIALGLAFSLLLAGLVESQVRLAADITELRRLREELERRATTDSLTGLANRGHFYDLAETHLARARRYGEALSLLVLDIDHFKGVNDTHGHLAGDAVLRGVGEQCRQVVRDSDLIGRMGGEEFAILLPSTGLAGAIQLAERLRLRLRAQRWTAPQVKDMKITASIGAAALTPAIFTLDDLYARADQALYAAKTGGRDRVCSLDSQDDGPTSWARP